MSIFVRSLTKIEKKQLKEYSHNGSDVILARRSIVIYASSRHIPTSQIAQVLDYSNVQVRRIIHLFEREGINGLHTKYGGGHPPIFTDQQRQAIVELAECHPRDLGIPLSQWSLGQLQAVLIKQKKVKYISRQTIRTTLLKAGLSKQRTKTWKESKDPQFEKKKKS
jgi:transposase